MAFRCEIEQGAIVAIVGANGAGKTTLIRAIAGMQQRLHGKIEFRGADIAGWPSYRVCNLGIGQVAEGRQVFPTLSVAENLDMGAMLSRARAESCEKQGAGSSPVPGARRAGTASRRDAVRRRAADAGDRPLPDGRTGTHHV